MIRSKTSIEVALMANTHQSYSEQLASEIEKVPDEFLPALLNIVHSFRESVSLPSAEESFREGWKEVMDDNTHPIDTLWDGIDAD